LRNRLNPAILRSQHGNALMPAARELIRIEALLQQSIASLWQREAELDALELTKLKSLLMNLKAVWASLGRLDGPPSPRGRPNRAYRPGRPRGGPRG
jgi:hypothetical protein